MLISVEVVCLTQTNCGIIGRFGQLGVEKCNFQTVHEILFQVQIITAKIIDQFLG